MVTLGRLSDWVSLGIWAPPLHCTNRLFANEQRFGTRQFKEGGLFVPKPMTIWYKWSPRTDYPGGPYVPEHLEIFGLAGPNLSDIFSPAEPNIYAP